MSGPLPDDVVQAFLERCRREDADVGLPRFIEDDDVLDRIAGIVADHRTTTAKNV
jgi:hypothetical protein